MKLKFTASLFSMIAICFQLTAQMGEGTTIDSINKDYINWYNLDLKTDNTMGTSTDLAYRDLLKNKSPKKEIIVAVIDGGVDINHVDLEGKIWINENEIPGNGIDDDRNGYIDDINGWNFIGNISGKNIDYENYEFVRVVAKYQSVFDSTTIVSELDSTSLKNYQLYQLCQQRYVTEIEKNENTIQRVNGFKENIDSLIDVIEPYTKTTDPTLEQITAVKTKNKDEKKAKKLLANLYKYGYTKEQTNAYLDYLSKMSDIYLNIELNAREIIGDDKDDFEDAFYGNNDVIGPDAGHGTFVAGIIAAIRNNNIGVNGIANKVKIMALRTVPNGDEDDKDVALSIKYAVDNGAHIINMSFGKDYSPNKYMVDRAIAYAESKGVLIVHAAGNDAMNNDTVLNYPLKELDNGIKVNNWITVGASSKTTGKELPGIFSNYGQTTVDLFAPGVDIVSLAPNNKYDQANGTSFSCPAVSGIAALVWSYYPDLSVSELKNILLNSAVPYTKKVIVPNETYSKKPKAPFTTLSITGGIANTYKALEMAEKSIDTN